MRSSEAQLYMILNSMITRPYALPPSRERVGRSGVAKKAQWLTLSFSHGPTNGPTDGPIDRLTDTANSKSCVSTTRIVML